MRGAPMERETALDVALRQIDKQFGKGSVMRMGERPSMSIRSIPTGAMALDLALGIGGLPRGRIVEIYGPESSGKSTLAMHVVAEAQRNGGICAYIDAEHAMDPVYAKAIGVNIDDLLISQPDTGEQALEIADMLIRSGALDVLVVDSVAALTPRAEIEGEMGDTHVGLQARLMSQALRKLTGTLSRSDTIAVFINQLREKIGIVYGSPEVTPGGRALKFYSSVRLDIRRIESIKDGGEVVGNRTRVKVVKNKCVAAGTTVFDPTTGRTHRIEEIVEKGEGASVMAADKLGRLHVRPIVNRFDQGEHEVLGLHLGDGTALWLTADHKVLTDRGWVPAGELGTTDRVARPRTAFGFGDEQPVPPDHARLLGYLIGDGYVGGKTPITFVNVEEPLQEDAAAIAASLGCDAHRRGIETSFSHRPGEADGVGALARWAGIWGHLAPSKRIPAPFFAPDVSAEVAANLLFGLFETDGWVSKEQTGGLRVGYTTTSEELAHQLHWLLLRWGIGSSVRVYDPKAKRPSVVGGRIVQGKLPCWEVRVSGIDNVEAFAAAVPMWGPRGQKLSAELADPSLRKHRGSQRGYLPASQSEPVLAYLRGLGVTPQAASQLLGDGTARAGGSLQAVLGVGRLRRDRLERLADALDSEFLRGVLAEDVWYDRIVAVSPPEWRPIYDIEVDEHHTFVANDVVVSNCSPPFKQCEFDIGFGKGISREGSLIDVGVNAGIVKKSGAWYTYEGEQLGQGRENAKQFLMEHPEVMVELDHRIRRQVGLLASPEGALPADDALGQSGDDDPIMIDD
ncbi:MAG TPA: intein-containing recombinase RecA [Acidimicrobiales bacterium]|nr:intein-containing recombinase RecA [Acidimicrobiales bacterium]